MGGDLGRADAHHVDALLVRTAGVFISSSEPAMAMARSRSTRAGSSTIAQAKALQVHAGQQGVAVGRVERPRSEPALHGAAARHLGKQRID